MNQALRAYCLAPDKVPVSIDDLLEAAVQHYGMTVETYIVGGKGEHVRGIFEQYADKTVRIYISGGLPDKMTRFIFVKELCHMMLANGDNQTKDPVDLIEHMLITQLVAENGEDVDQAALAEKLALVAAVELLFPHDLREAAKTDVMGRSATIFTLSEWLQVPEFVVELALSEPFERLRELYSSNPPNC